MGEPSQITALVCLPSVVPWVQVLPFWVPVQVLLLDPIHLVHLDQMDRSRRRPSEDALPRQRQRRCLTSEEKPVPPLRQEPPQKVPEPLSEMG